MNTRCRRIIIVCELAGHTKRMCCPQDMMVMVVAESVLKCAPHVFPGQ